MAGGGLLPVVFGVDSGSAIAGSYALALEIADAYYSTSSHPDAGGDRDPDSAICRESRGIHPGGDHVWGRLANAGADYAGNHAPGRNPRERTGNGYSLPRLR